MDRIVQLQLEVLADCIIQKDIWCEGENGLNELTPNLQTLLAPLLEGQIS